MADETTTHIEPEITDPAAKLESGKTHAKKAAEDLQAAATAKVNELRSAATAKANELRSTAETKANELRDRAGHVYDDARTRARSLREEGELYVRENPTRAVLTALGAGFLLGLIFRR